MFDVSRLVEVIKGMLFQPEPTWQAYLAENNGWRQTLTDLALPLMIGSLVLSLIVSFLFPGDDLAMTGLGLGGFVIGLIFGLIGFFIAAFLLALLAGLFDGQNDFDRAFAASSLTAIPSSVGAVIEPLPGVGMILYFLAAIYSMVLLYRIIPDALGVPQGRRVVHFIGFLIAGSVVFLVMGFFLLPIFAGA